MSSTGVGGSMKFLVSRIGLRINSARGDPVAYNSTEADRLNMQSHIGLYWPELA